MSSGYMGADATGTLPVQFCQKCGQALGTSWSIEGGLSFHPWCAPSVTRHHGAWSTDCNKTNLKVDELLARIAELEAKVASSLTEQRRLLADARAWRKTSEQAEAALAELREVERFARMAVDGDVDESAKGWMLLRDALTDLRAEEGGE